MSRFIVGDRAALGSWFEQMCRFRYDVFIRELCWDLPNTDHRGRLEVDAFDSKDALYVIAVDAQEVLGCARLLPTTVPNLLGNVFSHLLNNESVIGKEEVWEVSRLAFRNVGGPGSGKAEGRDLFEEALRVAASCGAITVVGVVSESVERFYRRSGFNLKRVGRVERTPGGLITACAIDVKAYRETGRCIRWAYSENVNSFSKEAFKEIGYSVASYE